MGKTSINQVIAAIAVFFLLHLFTSPGPALPLNDEDNDGGYNVSENGIHDETAPPSEKVTPITIRWNNINCSLFDKSSKSVRFLLKNVSGETKPGRLLAIMGPSGTRKTTLLNVLQLSWQHHLSCICQAIWSSMESLVQGTLTGIIYRFVAFMPKSYKAFLLWTMKKPNQESNDALQKHMVFKFGDHYYFRKELHILNLLTRVRWQGFGSATKHELSYLVSCTSSLLEEK